jgi:AI-2 transport protein TqsA
MEIRRQPPRSTALLRGMVVAACVVVLLAGLRSARVIIVPVLVAVFISVACAPIVTWLRRFRVPTPLAVAVVVLGIMAIGLLLTIFVGEALTEFARGLPRYQAVLAQRLTEVLAQAERWGLRIPEDQAPIDPGIAFNWVAILFASVRALLTSGLLILLTIVFILLEAAGFESKLRRALRDPAGTIRRFEMFATGVKQYLLIKIAVSALTGTLVALWVAILGLEFPLLWGLLAFLLNFIPTFGSIIASVPAALLALVQLGVGPAGLVLLGYLAVNMILGNLIEPRWAGYGVGLSPLVVFLSLILWGWVFGPVGLLLAAPLTMTLKIALESNPHTVPMAILLGPERIVGPPSGHEPVPPDRLVEEERIEKV